MPITKDVTLILGAGASIPYGFPSGRELVRQALDFPEQAANSLGISSAEIANFQQELRYSMSDSIDAFLETRGNDYLDLGKAIIAALLIPYEEPHNLRIAPQAGARWYDYLWKMLRTQSKEEFAQNRLRIVTFNYDRSLEFALLRAIQSTYRTKTSESAELLSAIQLVHVHGTLAQLPELAKPVNGAPGYTRRYDGQVNTDRVFSAQQCIKIIHENLDDTEELRRARGMVQQAKTVVFLGFGYHKRNVQRLKLDEVLRDDAQLYGTLGADLTNSEFGADIAPLFQPFRKRCEFWTKRYTDTLAFLKDHRDLF